MSAGDSLTSPSTDSKTTREGFDKVPDELLVEILSYVQKEDYLNIMLVNRRFNRISKDRSLWTKVDLTKPRTSRQVSQLVTTVFPSISSEGVVEELKITGFLQDPVVTRGGHPRIDYILRENHFRDRLTPRTLSSKVLAEIQASCPGLKTLVVRNCSLRFVPASMVLKVPDTVQKLEFHNSRVPDSRRSWLGQGTDQGQQQELPNLVTLKLERCWNPDRSFEGFLRSCPALKNLSLKGSVAVLEPHEYRWDFPTNFWNTLKVLDISGTGCFPHQLYAKVLKNIADCSLTHLYMERCLRIPRIVRHDHLKLEFLSVAGLRDVEYPRVLAFECIQNWAALPSLTGMNVSGCEMSQAQREQLVTRHNNVIFNISVETEESPRVEF